MVDDKVMEQKHVEDHLGCAWSLAFDDVNGYSCVNN